MLDTTQAPQIPVKVDQRKVMTPEKLERLRLAREKRARNQLLREEKRMEVAKQFILAAAGQPESTKAKSNPEEKKLKWESRKSEMIAELMQKMGEANVRWKELTMKPEPETESSESELSGVEEPPAKRPKKSKPPVAKPKPAKTKKLSSHSDSFALARKKRSPGKPVDYSTSVSDSESDVEHENVLQLW